MTMNLRLPDFGAATVVALGAVSGVSSGAAGALRGAGSSAGVVRACSGTAWGNTRSSASDSVRMIRAAWSLVAAIKALPACIPQRQAVSDKAVRRRSFLHITIDRTVRSRYIPVNKTIGSAPFETVSGAGFLLES